MDPNLGLLVGYGLGSLNGFPYPIISTLLGGKVFNGGIDEVDREWIYHPINI
jgi:hypothetical protein